MLALQSLHKKLGAVLADDGIPLHYGDQKAEYQAALTQSILLDRSHKGRLTVHGAGRFDLLNRISTNQTIQMAEDEGRATLFLNANGRILDRIVVYNRSDHVLIITEAGRGVAVKNYLQRNIFFGDDVQLTDISNQTAQFALHGAQVSALIARCGMPEKPQALYGHTLQVAGATIYAAKRKAICGDHWMVVCPIEAAHTVYQALLDQAAPDSLQPAGSLTYNTLRIRAGKPARVELSTDYIPLEIGLWDEVSFTKGCYTGQEIIARMESRKRVAKTIVALALEQFVSAPGDVYQDGKLVGRLTSSVTAPDGEIFTIAIIKTASAIPDTALTVGEQHIGATVTKKLGVQPDFITE